MSGDSSTDPGGEQSVESFDADRVLDDLGFAAEESILTRRQAEVLVLREQGFSQAAIADYLGTSRANVSGVESSARENVERATETVAFADAVSAPVRLTVDPGSDLYDLPQRIFAAADDADVKVNHTAPDLMKVISDAAGDAVRGRQVRETLRIGVSADGSVSVRRKRS